MKSLKTDSSHEDYFQWWAEEAMSHGIITKIERGKTVEFCPKKIIPFGRDKDKFLFHPFTYTWDYTINWNTTCNLPFMHDDLWLLNSSSVGYFYSQSLGRDSQSMVDIKPDRIGKNTQYTAITFPINQKLMWHLHGIYVQKVVLYPATNTQGKHKTLFTETWTPQKLIDHPDWRYKKDSKFGKQGGSRIKWPVRTDDMYFSTLF